MRRKTGVRVSAGGLVALAEERSACESQACAAGDARTWVAGEVASSASTTKERVGPRGSRGAESDLAVGHDEDLGGSGSGLGLSGERDRLLHTGDRGVGLVSSLPYRRRAGSSGTGCVRTAA